MTPATKRPRWLRKGVRVIRIEDGRIMELSHNPRSAPKGRRGQWFAAVAVRGRPVWDVFQAHDLGKTWVRAPRARERRRT